MRLLRATLALAILAGAGLARAQTFVGLVDVSYVNSRLTLTDPAGRNTDFTTSAFPQRYRLSYDQQFFPFLAASASGYYQWTPATITTAGVQSEVNRNLWNVFARVVIGPPVLNVTPFYQRREEFNQSRIAGQAALFTPTLVNQAYGAYAGWNPFGLPTLGLKLSRTEDFDSRRVTLDTSTNEGTFDANYLEIQNLTLRYFARFVTQHDAIQSLDTSQFSTGGQVQWSGAFLERRLTTSVTYNLGYRTSSVSASSGGFVSVQQFPSAGLSLVELFPSTPSRVTLAPNPSLIDGDTATSAGIDIGYSLVLAGDNNYRDLGLQFPNLITDVNNLRVWVDRALPVEVWTAYAWTAWKSDDNITWVEVPLAGPIVFATFNNRFEIPIARTQARYLKVVTKPLAPAVTVDRQFADIFVTEVQAFLVVPASEAPRHLEQTAGNFSGNLRFLIERDWNLAYDLAAYFSHGLHFTPDFWSVLNAISAGRQLSRVWSVNGRIERTDSGRSIGHEATNRLSLQAAAEPIPGLGGAVIYSGQYSQLNSGNVLTNGFTLLGHADPYEGVSLVTSATYSLARDSLGQKSSGLGWLVGATVVPVRAIAINGSWNLNTSFVSSGVATIPRQSVFQGSISFTPIAAFLFSAGITRVVQTDRPTQNLINFGASFSPFPGGQLLLNFAYNDSLDTGAALRARVFGPSLRWNIRPGTYLNVSYTWNDSAQPALATYGETLFAQLVVSIR